MKKIIIIYITILFFTIFFFYNNAFAQPTSTPPGTPGSGEKIQPVTLPDPLGKTTPQALIGKIIKAVLGIVGSLALVMFIYGGFTWMLAGGNAEKVTKGRNILVWATIGLVVIFSSYALVKFVIDAITKG